MSKFDPTTVKLHDRECPCSKCSNTLLYMRDRIRTANPSERRALQILAEELSPVIPKTTASGLLACLGGEILLRKHENTVILSVRPSSPVPRSSTDLVCDKEDIDDLILVLQQLLKEMPHA